MFDRRGVGEGVVMVYELCGDGRSLKDVLAKVGELDRGIYLKWALSMARSI